MAAHIDIGSSSRESTSFRAPVPEVLWKTLTSLGQAYRALKQVDLAQQSFDEAIAILEKMRGQLVGSERDQQLLFENKTRFEEQQFGSIPVAVK